MPHKDLDARREYSRKLVAKRYFKNIIVPRGQKCKNLFEDAIKNNRPMNTQEGYAYVAGLLDGEGCISIVHRHFEKYGSDTYVPTLYISNSNRDALEVCRVAIPEFTYFSIQRCNGGGRKKDAYVLGSSKREKILKLLSKIYPYLVIKKKHAELMMEFCSSRLSIPYRSKYMPREVEIYNELKSLNRRGLNAVDA